MNETENSTRIFCHNCGNEIKNNPDFCPSCGAKQTETEQQTENKKSDINVKKPVIISIIIAAVVLCIAFVFITFGNDENKLVGSWVPVGAHAPDNFPNNMNLYEGGSANVESYDVNYNIEDDYFTLYINGIIWGPDELSYLYEIENGILYLSAYGDKIKYVNLEGNASDDISAYYFAESVKEGDGLSKYLVGSWIDTSEDSLKYFTGKDDEGTIGNIRYNLPVPEHPEDSYYELEDNVIHFNNGEYNAFRFEPIDENNMYIYCFEDDEYYKMTRDNDEV